MKIERREVAQYDHAAALRAVFPEGPRDPTAVRGWNVALRMRLGESQNWRCCYCGVRMNRRRRAPTVCTIEHVIPAIAGGRACWETCVAACKRCNEERSVEIARIGAAPLALPFCPKCGGRDLHEMRPGVLCCAPCRLRFRLGETAGMPFGVVRFGALRRVVGEMLVNKPSSLRLARVLGIYIFRDPFIDTQVVTEALLDLSKRTIEEAERAFGDDLVAAYNAAIVALWYRHVLIKAEKPPRGGCPKLPIRSDISSSDPQFMRGRIFGHAPVICRSMTGLSRGETA